MNVKILADSTSQLEDVLVHFKTHTKCWVWGLRWLAWWLKRLSGERGTRFRWVLEVSATP